MTDQTIVVVGGTSGIGLELAKDIVARGDRVVLTGRDEARAREVAASLGDRASGIALDISEPETIAGQLSGLGAVHGLVLAAIERDANTVRDYDVGRARRLVTLKLIGYTEVVHALLDRLEPSRATGIVLFGGRAKDAPYPGSTTVSTINGGVEGLVASLALELAPIRVNARAPWHHRRQPVLVVEAGRRARWVHLANARRRARDDGRHRRRGAVPPAQPRRLGIEPLRRPGVAAHLSGCSALAKICGFFASSTPGAADVSGEHPLRLLGVLVADRGDHEVVLLVHDPARSAVHDAAYARRYGCGACSTAFRRGRPSTSCRGAGVAGEVELPVEREELLGVGSDVADAPREVGEPVDVALAPGAGALKRRSSGSSRSRIW